jgi:cobalt-zinc-cadmium efflux system membrane fusion protein
MQRGLERMNNDDISRGRTAGGSSRANGLVITVIVIVFVVGAAAWWSWKTYIAAPAPAAANRPIAAAPGRNARTDLRLASITVETVTEQAFVSEMTTEGKISVDEERVTPVFSQFSGRVIKIFARPGQQVKQGEPLFSLEAVDVVQSQNELMAAVSGLNKAHSQLRLSQTAERRLRDLHAINAIATRDYQQAQNDLTASQNDVRAAEIVLAAVRNKLRLSGKSDADIAAFEQTGRISTETIVVSPIDGMIIQRKVGQGQFLTAGAAEQTFTLGDLSRVWLVASVRESDTGNVFIGQRLEFRVIAYPDRAFKGEVAYIGSSVDAGTRRIPVRAVIENADMLLRPEMFTSVRLLGKSQGTSPSVPRAALIYEGNTSRAWIMGANDKPEMRKVQPGLVAEDRIQILSGLQAGEQIITKGVLFIDRAAALGGN